MRVFDKMWFKIKYWYCCLFGHDFWEEKPATMINPSIRCKRCHKRQMLGK